MQEAFRVGQHGAVGGFHDVTGAHGVGVPGVHAAVVVGEHQQVHVQLDDLVGGDVGGEAAHRAVRLAVGAERVEVQAAAGVRRAVLVADGHDQRAGRREGLRGLAAPVPETVHGHAGALDTLAVLAQDARGDQGGAAATRVLAAVTAAQRQGFADHHAAAGLAGVLVVGVEHPGHGLRVGADIGRQDVLAVADQFDQFAGVAAQQAFHLVGAEFGRIDVHAALGPAERQVGHGGLEGHDRGEHLALVGAQACVQAHAAHAGAA